MECAAMLNADIRAPNIYAAIYVASTLRICHDYDAF